MEEYDCENCKRKCLYNRRICFLREKNINAEAPIIGEIDRGGEKKVAIIGKESRVITKMDVINQLEEIHNRFPNKLVHELLKTPFLMYKTDKSERPVSVCPISLFDPESEYYVSLETAAGKYHTLPYGDMFGCGYLDQPLYIVQAFDAARSAEARYNNIKMNRISKDSSKSK